jgi:M6 family metalloprotease-like protein
MKRFSLIFCLLLFSQLAIAEKMKLQKISYPQIEEKNVHPLETEFSGVGKREILAKSRNFENLLVLLVQFQPDTTSTTTGNGQFVQDTTGYQPSLGKPPHNYQFFSDQLTSLRYYYKAVSFGNFNLNYDIFPVSKSGEFNAYTLPHKLSYYSPGTSDQQLMVSRFEEYFADCFHIADQTSPQIDFSQYDHFMLIHAGSDWQHDVLGNSPNDMPSFFITMGDGKEVYVDDGTVMIDYACNVPETITQDIEQYETNSMPIVYNYGVINAVMAHEFGHSLGFVDLYNTYNHRPEVGYWDIMDSGGAGLSGVVQDTDGDGQDDKLFYIEGVLPTLPSVWTRLLVWENEFQQERIYKNASDLTFDEEIILEPVEKKLTENCENPYFVKIPLGNEEYLLLENRQVDSDGDGGTSVVTTSGNRVALYPCRFDDPYDQPTYEYDYLLPGWQKSTGEAVGGGIVVWHIDQKILYENNNFANNSVNTSHSNRAVKIIEADNLPDIGNAYSQYWRGTAYEPYHRYLPELSSDGYFLNWDIDYAAGQTLPTFNDELSSTSEPALQLNSGQNSIYRVYDIGSCSLQADQTRTISFKLGTQYFQNTSKIAESDSLQAIGPVGNIYDFPTFPVVEDNKVELFSIINNTVANHLQWEEEYTGELTQPITVGRKSPNNEFYLVANNKLTIVSDEYISENEYPTEITSPPLYLPEISQKVVATAEILYIGESQFDLPAAKLAYNNSQLIAVTDNVVNFIDIENRQITHQINLPHSTANYEPVCYNDTLNAANSAVFIQDEQANIYKLSGNDYERIFTAENWGNEASQLALGKLTDENQVYITFGIRDRVFALTLDGTLLEGFPAYVENKNILANSFPEIINFAQATMIVLSTDNDASIAIDNLGNQHPEFSISNSEFTNKHSYFWQGSQKNLFYFHQDSNHNLFASRKDSVQVNPLVWQGYRNNHSSLYEAFIDMPISETENLAAFAFPNPAKKGEFRIKVKNAKADIKIKIFDIAGHKIYSDNIEKNDGNSKDIWFSTDKFSSGVYFAVISSRGETQKVPIAIIK